MLIFALCFFVCYLFFFAVVNNAIFEPPYDGLEWCLDGVALALALQGEGPVGVGRGREARRRGGAERGDGGDYRVTAGVGERSHRPLACAPASG